MHRPPPLFLPTQGRFLAPPFEVDVPSFMEKISSVATDYLADFITTYYMN